jgi:hypothetical protein
MRESRLADSSDGICQPRLADLAMWSSSMMSMISMNRLNNAKLITTDNSRPHSIYALASAQLDAPESE